MDYRIRKIYDVVLSQGNRILSKNLPNRNFVKILQERKYPVKGKHESTISRKRSIITVTGKEKVEYKKEQVTVACLVPNEDS